MTEMSRLRTKTVIYPTPLDAANAFYEAFEARDIEGMMAVWAEDEEIICVHPGGQRLVGYAAVRASWSDVFGGGAQLHLQVSGPIVLQTISMAIQSVTEHLIVSEDQEAGGVVEATNIFLHTPSGWRMLMHHASPSPAARRAPATPPARLH
jgi:ketosteroid isomerase-like protein